MNGTRTTTIEVRRARAFAPEAHGDPFDRSDFALRHLECGGGDVAGLYDSDGNARLVCERCGELCAPTEPRALRLSVRLAVGLRQETMHWERATRTTIRFVSGEGNGS